MGVSKFIEIKEYKYDQTFYKVWLKVDQQSFHIGGCDYETLEEAQFMADMFEISLTKMLIKMKKDDEPN